MSIISKLLGYWRERRRRRRARKVSPFFRHLVRLEFLALEDRTLLASPVLSPLSWTDLGPAPIANGQTPGSDPVSGRITGIAGDSSRLYVAAAGGGVWGTTDEGQHWSALTDNQASLFLGAVAVAPSDPHVIYAATGEANNSIDSFAGRGVLKSTDGGQSWTLLPGNAGSANPAAFYRQTISRIVVDPTSADTVYVAVAGGGADALRDANGNVVNSGIWKSTDGGATWTNTTALHPPPNLDLHADTFSDLAIDPAHPATLYAAVGNSSGAAHNGLYRTTDGGASWTQLNGLYGNLVDGTAYGRISLAVSPSAPSTLYAAIAGSGQAGTTA